MRILFMAVVAAIAAIPAAAQVTHISTDTTVTREFKPDVFGNPQIQVLTGRTIGGNEGSGVFGSGTSYQSTSRADSGGIWFKNSNAASGELSKIDSFTSVVIAFKNDGSAAVRPTLDSTILPAGIGLYVGPNCLSTITGCGPDTPAPFGKPNFDHFGGGPDGRIAGATFDFRVLGGGSVLYDLSGSLGFAEDPATGVRSLFTDLDAASASLLNFHATSPLGSGTEFGFQWDATPIAVAFPSEFLLAPGEETTLTYETRVTTYSFAPCTSNLLSGTCLNAYSSFGDPLGKGSGGPGPGAMSRAFGLEAAAEATAEKLQFFSFYFALPTFTDGTLSYQPRSLTGAVPEPSAWLLLIAGFGLTGSVLRRRRTLRTV